MDVMEERAKISLGNLHLANCQYSVLCSVSKKCWAEMTVDDVAGIVLLSALCYLQGYMEATGTSLDEAVDAVIPLIESDKTNTLAILQMIRDNAEELDGRQALLS